MDYEIVELKEKVIVGISANTSNEDPKMPEIIGGLWKRLYSEGIGEGINNKANHYSVGLYSDYTESGYTVTVGYEVSKADNADLSVKVLPASKYAKFLIKGNMVTAVAKAWSEIWKMDLDRSFTGDFEEYHDSDCENGEIAIYIALK